MGPFATFQQWLFNPCADRKSGWLQEFSAYKTKNHSLNESTKFPKLTSRVSRRLCPKFAPRDPAPSSTAVGPLINFWISLEPMINGTKRLEMNGNGDDHQDICHLVSWTKRCPNLTHMITISGYKPRRWNLWAAEYGNCWEKSFGVSSFIDSPRICPASNTNTISVRTSWVWGIALLLDQKLQLVSIRQPIPKHDFTGHHPGLGQTPTPLPSAHSGRASYWAKVMEVNHPAWWR